MILNFETKSETSLKTSESVECFVCTEDDNFISQNHIQNCPRSNGNTDLTSVNCLIVFLSNIYMNVCIWFWNQYQLVLELYLDKKMLLKCKAFEWGKENLK